VEKTGVAAKTIALVHLRTSQINGCSVCVDMHARELKEAGEKDERIWASGRGGSRRTAINVWNRLNAAIRQPVGSAS
jgi:AhpD family alkylhydroperoxidase